MISLAKTNLVLGIGQKLTLVLHKNQDIVVTGNFEVRRKQYALQHVGALIINKPQCGTIPSGIAVKISST